MKKGEKNDLPDQRFPNEAITPVDGSSENNCKELFQSLADTTSSAIFIFNEKGFHFMNKVGEEITGYAQEELKSIPPWDLLHPDHQHLRRIKSIPGKKGQPVSKRYEFSIISKDGSVKWLDYTIGKVKYNGEIAFIGTAFDISFRKKTISALVESQRMYKTLFYGSPEGILVAKISTRKFIIANPAICKILGYTEQELITLGVADIYPKFALEEIMREYDAQAQGEKITAHGLPCLRKDGTIIYCNISTTKVIIGSEECNLGFFSDVSDFRQAEKKLKVEASINMVLAKLSKELLSPNLSVETISTFILESAKEITNSTIGTITAKDPTTRDKLIHLFSLENEKFFSDPKKIHKTDLSKNQSSGNAVGNLLTSTDSFYSNDRASIAESLPRGHINLERYLSVPVLFNENHVGQIYLANSPHDYSETDLSNVKKLANLYGIAIYRKQIDNELVTAMKRAEESDRLKTAFLENMSHEIRTPMNGIIGFSELLHDFDLTNEQRQEYVGYIQSSSKVLLNLINDIMDISKIEAGQMDIQLITFSLTKLLHDLLNIFVGELVYRKDKNVTLELSLPPKISQLDIRSDPFRLRQILSNLISNAIKFTDDGMIEFGFTSKDSSWLLFYVKDTGIGLKKEKLRMIFNRFHQVNENTGKLYRGAGLGLSISKNLVELLGGKMWVNSEFGKGSTFFFTLPTKGMENSIPEKSYPERERAIKKYDWTDKKILVVEDEDINYKLILASLQDTNVGLFRAKTGYEAIEMCENIPSIDLILMDIHLPELGGYEATQHILQRCKSLPIIAQTAYALTEEREKLMKAGFSDYLIKPFDKQKLIEILARYLT